MATILLSLFFAVLKIGAEGMQSSAHVSNYIYLIIQTIIIFFMAAESGIFSAIENRRMQKAARREALARQEGGTANG